MIRPEFLKMLRCPETRSTLSEADEPTVKRLNDAVAAGTLVNRCGQKVEKPLDGGLVREDGAVLYPIIDAIPILLVDEAIPLTATAVNGARP